MSGLDFRRSAVPLTVELLETVADRERVDVMDLPPLGRAIDPDALNKLFDTPRIGPPRPPNAVRFNYCGYTVVIDQDRNVWLD